MLGQGKIEYDPNTDKLTGDYQLPFDLYERLNKGITLDENGAFTISNVAPGIYFLVFRATKDGPIKRAFIAQDIINVKAGEGVDLGEIPIPTK
jgi:hypothetical protein